MKNLSSQSDEDFKTQISRLTEIGIALSAELHLDVLLEKIVHYARELTSADGGTLYLLSDNQLQGKIAQNDTLGIYQGGATGEPITVPTVPLEKSSVSAYAALMEKTVKIDDVYDSDEFDFTGPKRFDASRNYRTRSMLVVPMKNHEGSVIGVLLLSNAMDAETGEVTVFPDAVVNLIEALASQAAVAIINASLIEETKALFESLITVLAVAVDAKSKYTGNHVQRVAQFNLMLAQAINEAGEKPFADVHFSQEELEEMRIAGWLHDVGKVTTPVWVMDKATKLESLFDRTELIQTRFGLIRRNLEIQTLEKKLAHLQNGGNAEELFQIGGALKAQLEELDEELQFLIQCNQPGEFMEDAKLERLHQIARKTYIEEGEEKPYLTKDELHNLSIRKGTLTEEEFQVMRDHVVWTIKMLAQIPFTKHLENVPLYAGQHHERLDGTGYPYGLKMEDLPLQSRILALADFYESLTAKDRPYKVPMPTEVALSILQNEADAGKIDSDILDLMIRECVHEKFERAYDAQKKETSENIEL
ncbi:MAG: GAF domain-containing protein [Candidatus Poribacteria bacterium]|nr:GAF domain-containing protein [Candidatus Poribacteria bacterium]